MRKTDPIQRYGLDALGAEPFISSNTRFKLLITRVFSCNGVTTLAAKFADTDPATEWE